MTTKVDDLIANGAGRKELEAVPVVNFSPRLAPDALHGLAGRIIEAIEPYSEADPAAILMHVLVAAGNVIGRGPHTLVEKTVHACNEYVALVGSTANGRKGTAWSTPRHMLALVDPSWRIRHGLSSGEGVIYHVRDAREEQQPIKERGRVIGHESVAVDAGEADKRVLVIEAELATVLKRMQGETNSLSAVLRESWDTGDLATLTKNSPLRATGAHISIVGHVTPEELVTSLTETDRANGFANRFLFMLVSRSKCLPDAESIPDERLAPLVDELDEVVKWAREPRLIRRDPEARALWAAVYPKLTEGEPGLIGAILARAAPHVLRLSLTYAVLDRSPVVRPPHLHAALAVWDYAETSARRIFGDVLGLSVADTILAALRKRGPMTRTEIRDLFGRNKPAAEIDAVLAVLEHKGKVRKWDRPAEGGKGRPAEVWELVA